MKVRVAKSFKDKHTKMICSVGQIIEVSNERYDELISTALGPFVDAVEETIPKKPAEEKKSAKKPTSKAKSR
jgi:hypothetical protein